MKIILFSRRGLAFQAEELQTLREVIAEFGFDYAVNEEFAKILNEQIGWEIPSSQRYGAQIETEDQKAVLVCYGGDGTLLEGVHRLGGRQLPVVGINAGRLGFLTSDSRTGLKRLFAALGEGELCFEERSLIEVEGDLPSNNDTPLALNEFSIQRNGAGMLSVEIYVDEKMVATCHGDGVIVSTPTGSTAYSLSAGGPVVAPTCACFVITPIAPHNLTMRPVVIPDSSQIRLRVEARRSEAFLTLDNRSYGVPSESEFRLRKASKSIFLAVPHNISFYDTLRNKMMWGVDIRS
jgi:NAD+ kinase